MSLRDRLRGVKERVQSSRDNSGSSRAAAARERLQRARAHLAHLEQVDAGRVPQSQDQSRKEFERAQQTAMASPPVDATLSPIGTPQAVERVAHGSQQRDGESMEAFVTGGAGSESTDQRTLEDLVVGGGAGEPDREAGGPRLDSLATGTSSAGSKDDQGQSMESFVSGGPTGETSSKQDDDSLWRTG